MALPVEPQRTAELYKDVLNFLRTKQVDGQTKQKRRLVVKTGLSAGLEMGGRNPLVLALSRSFLDLKFML